MILKTNGMVKDGGGGQSRDERMNAAVDGKGKPANVSLLLKSWSRRPKRTRSDTWLVANGGAGPNRTKQQKRKAWKAGARPSTREIKEKATVEALEIE